MRKTRPFESLARFNSKQQERATFARSAGCGMFRTLRPVRRRGGAMSKIPPRRFPVTLLVVLATLGPFPIPSSGTNNQQREVVPQPSDLSVPDQKAGAYYALVIGISKYQSLPKLSTPENDAREMAAVLQNQFGFQI